MAKDDYEDTLRMLTEARKDETVLKNTLRAQLWAEYQKRLQAARYRTSRLANKARAQGATNAAIGRAYGTSNWETVKKLLTITEGEFIEGAAAVEEIRKGWEWNEATRVVTVHEWLDRVDLRQPRLRRERRDLQMIHTPGYGWDFSYDDKQAVHIDTLGPIRDEINGVADAGAAPPVGTGQEGDYFKDIATWATNPDAQDEED